MLFGETIIEFYGIFKHDWILECIHGFIGHAFAFKIRSSYICQVPFCHVLMYFNAFFDFLIKIVRLCNNEILDTTKIRVEWHYNLYSHALYLLRIVYIIHHRFCAGYNWFSILKGNALNSRYKNFLSIR